VEMVLNYAPITERGNRELVPGGKNEH
jgi:hypothetical protein